MSRKQQQQQQPPPMVKLTSKNHRALPVLDYYLTFIHYFGFGINPDDDHRSRYLSIRVKRGPTVRTTTNAEGAHNAASRWSGGGGAGYRGYGAEYQQMQWLASYTRRVRRRLHSLPFPLFTYLKTTMKYLAIAFNTFIALNHCVVLGDYIYSGSREIEDLILEIRLVITKLSALIFVLAWHHNRYEVRQIIKLVKSTSLYILATHGLQLQQQQQQQQRQLNLARHHHHHHHHHQLAAGSACQRQPLLLAPESPIPSPTVAANTTALGGSIAKVEAGSRLTGPAGGTSTTTTTNQQHNANVVKPAAAGAATEELISDEIGSSLRLDTSAFDRRILKGWFGCLLIIIVHFSLSEAEISKSHHLWQWLDDYSLHQLGNQSISYRTLIFLATVDNYIYTVHVYGTRLIGASIICIVCSLQHEVIKSLNLYTLRLVQRSQQPLLSGAYCTSDTCSCGRVASPIGRPGNNSDNHSPELLSPVREELAEASNIFSMLSTSSSSSRNSLLHRDAKQQTAASRQSFQRNSSTFFVLGESDWFLVRDLRDQLEPHGHLTACIWQTWRLILGSLAGLLTPLSRNTWRLVDELTAQLSTVTVFGRRSLSRTSPEHENKSEAGGDLLHGGVTPKLMNANEQSDGLRTTFGQVASSLISSNSLDHRRSQLESGRRAASVRPTPLTLSSAAILQGGANSTRIPGHHFAFEFKGHAMQPNEALRQRRGSKNRPQRFLTRTIRPASQHWVKLGGGGIAASVSALSWANPLRSSDDYHARLVSLIGAGRADSRPKSTQFNGPVAQQQLATSGVGDQWTALGARKIELQMERLSTKYELVRTVNARIDACFGPMLLIQFSFLFLMSCIDLVFFSLCFSPNTKTKYIIISGMILLWCPYMLIYKFASDMGSSSKELLVSIRRLARLYQLEDQACLASASDIISDSPQVASAAPTGTIGEHQQHLWSTFRVANESTNRFLYGGRHLLATADEQTTPTVVANRGTKLGAGIVDKLDHIFKPTHLSIMGVMMVDKFFLLNFAKIVITSSVMMIQFISN